MALVHKTKKEEGKKLKTKHTHTHKKKKKNHKKSNKYSELNQEMTDLGCLGLIQSRFRLFRHDSRPFWLLVDMIQFWPNRPSLARIPKKKKKTTDAAPTLRQQCRWPHPVLDAGAAPSQQHWCFLSRNYYIGKLKNLNLPF